jgi:hypothetical protein
MKKLYNDKDQVAVLVSPGHGTGWFGANPEYPDCVFDQDIVWLIIHDKREEIPSAAKHKWKNFNVYGSDELTIVWVDQGKKFRISEYEGHETLILLENDVTFTA